MSIILLAASSSEGWSRLFEAFVAPFAQIITILLLVSIMILLARRKNISVERIADMAMQQAFGVADAVAPAEPLVSQHGGKGPSSLEEGLLFYFNQTNASRIVLRVLTKHFEGERVRFSELAKAIDNEVRTRNLDHFPKSTLRIALRLLMGADFVAEDEGGFRTTALGKRLQHELDARRAKRLLAA